MTALDDEGVRHKDLETICGRLHRIMVGRTAASILDNEDIPEKGSLARLPSWCWRQPLIDMGRKQKDSMGNSTLLMPIRLNWTGGVIQVISDSATVNGHIMRSSTANGQAIGLGHDEARSLETSADPLHPVSRESLIAILEGLVEQGERAEWDQIAWLEPSVRRLVMRKHAHVSKEIHAFSTQALSRYENEELPVQDEVDLEEIINQMILGVEPEDDSLTPEERIKLMRESSSVFRLIDLCIRPDCFRRVDPIKYMEQHLARDAESAIRARLGDPHIGPKVRRVSLLHPDASLEELIAIYNELYPNDHLAETRANDALWVKPSPDAQSYLMQGEVRNVMTARYMGNFDSSHTILQAPR